jgi:hypothetical protein
MLADADRTLTLQPQRMLMLLMRMLTRKQRQQTLKPLMT